MKTKTKKPTKGQEENGTCTMELPAIDLKKSSSVLAAINEATKQKNVAFEKLSKMEQRVVIAKDVKAAIKAAKYKVSPGTYVRLIDDTKIIPKKKYIYENGETKNTFRNLMKEEVTCNVCAIGSMFVSSVRKSADKSMTGNDDVMVKKLAYVYTEEELRILEMAFEGQDITEMLVHSDDPDDKRKLKNTKDFYQKHYDDDEERLVAIMDNIIKNKGHFIYRSIKI
jgi:hypothetical protein